MISWTWGKERVRFRDLLALLRGSGGCPPAHIGEMVERGFVWLADGILAGRIPGVLL